MELVEDKKYPFITNINIHAQYITSTTNKTISFGYKLGFFSISIN